MTTATSLSDLVQRFNSIDVALPDYLCVEVPVADGVLHIDETCPVLGNIHFGVKFETRSIRAIHTALSCTDCAQLSNRADVLEAIEEPLSEAVAALVACERSDCASPRVVNLGSLINSLRPSIWVQNAAIDVLLRALEQRFVPVLPASGTAWLVKRGAGAPLALLPDGLHHASGYSILLLPRNMVISSAPSRHLSVTAPFAPQLLCENVTPSELLAARALFFQMVTGGTEPSVALQAALAI